jgi:pantetheine-phosphate adenylyltransferase
MRRGNEDRSIPVVSTCTRQPDPVKRMTHLFDRVIVAVVRGREKQGMFTWEERVEMFRKAVEHLPSVEVEGFDEMTVEFARRKGAVAIVRGIRAVSDFEAEFDMALMNRKMAPHLESVYLMANQDYLYISASRIREVSRLGYDCRPRPPACSPGYPQQARLRGVVRLGGAATSGQTVEILDLIDSLEELVIQARRLPVGGNLVVDRKRMLDVIDQMRLAVPSDLREAARVLEARDQIIEEAHRAAHIELENAEAERARLVEESAILREAHERSQQMLRDAEARARETIAEADATAAAHLSEAAEAATRELDDADQYALEVLRRLENQLQTFLDSIRVSIGSVQEKR